MQRSKNMTKVQTWGQCEVGKITVRAEGEKLRDAVIAHIERKLGRKILVGVKDHTVVVNDIPVFDVFQCTVLGVSRGSDTCVPIIGTLWFSLPYPNSAPPPKKH